MSDSVQSEADSFSGVLQGKGIAGTFSDTNFLYRSKSTIDRFRTIASVDNPPYILSNYDERMRRMLQLNPTLSTNRVHIPWYRRYVDVIPDKDHQSMFQPFREIQTRDEDIALQHQYGFHDCLNEYVARGMCRHTPADCRRIREAAMARYERIKKREEEKKERRDHQPPDDTFVLPGQDIDFATEFGFSANKKKMVVPVVEFLCKLHVNRERSVLRRRLSSSSKWHALTTYLRPKIQEMIKAQRKIFARNRIRRLFSLVLCVDRFIKCVAMIAGDTQTLLKDTTHRSLTKIPVRETPEDKPEKEIAFFNVHNYTKVGQVQVPFHIQMILSKPWFCRSNKEVEMAVRFLEKMRCFTAYPRPFQFMLARVAWYLELPTQKVVIRQSQQAVNFYLLLNGSVRIDRLEGSPCVEESGYFETLNVLSSQDMFGDECVTAPFSERFYTATTEEKCAALDFNMHDYNNMIQTANTSEEAPDHIRFLCKLRIMDNFPKIKLLQEQDNNVTYFFFRPGSLVCKSIRDSPYVFVVRNGSCSILQELKPKITDERLSRIMSTRVSTIPGSTKFMGSISSATSEKRKSRRVTKTSSNFYNDLQMKLAREDKNWVESTRKSFEQSKLNLRESILNIREKAESLTLTQQQLEAFNLDPHPVTESAVSQRKSSSCASLRWDVDESQVPVPRKSITDMDSGRASLLGSARQSFDMTGRQSKIIGTNIPINMETFVGDYGKAQSSGNVNNSSNSHKKISLPPIKESRRQVGHSTQSSNVSGSAPTRKQSVAGKDRQQSMAEKDRNQSVAEKDRQQSMAAKDRNQSMAGKDWNQSMAGKDRNQSMTGKDRNQSMAGKDRNQSMAGKDRNQTMAGKDRNQSMAGKDQNQSMAGKDRNQSMAEKDRNQSMAGKDRNQSMTGKDRNQSMAGKDHNNSMAGKDRNQSMAEKDRNQSMAGKDRNQSMAGKERNQSMSEKDRKQSAPGKDHTRSVSFSKRKRSGASRKSEHDYPLSKFSQWTQKALLTVTDVAGVDWLDYNDGTYNPPLEDSSLVSHGATVIMIKKDFMLKYLRRVW